jgi:hypothetical protein
MAGSGVTVWTGRGSFTVRRFRFVILFSHIIDTSSILCSTCKMGIMQLKAKVQEGEDILRMRLCIILFNPFRSELFSCNLLLSLLIRNLILLYMLSFLLLFIVFLLSTFYFIFLSFFSPLVSLFSSYSLYINSNSVD